MNLKSVPQRELFFYLKDPLDGIGQKAIGGKQFWEGDREKDIAVATEWVNQHGGQLLCPVFLPFEPGPRSMQVWVPDSVWAGPLQLPGVNRMENLKLLEEVNPENAYSDCIRKALVDLKNHQYEKIVLARGYNFEKSKDWDIEFILNAMNQAQTQNALVGWQETIFSEADVKVQKHALCNGFLMEYGFAASTPERLFSLKDGVLKSEAVAGTVRRGASPQEDATLAEELLACVKTTHEHNCVVEMIVESLNRLGFRVVCGQREIRKLLFLQHVVTPITAYGTTHALEVAAVLHPTPAVCGYPKNEAFKAISALEPFERKGYAGAFGWVNAKGEGSFFVGLRGVQWQNDVLQVLAGCGIVATSDPESELQEANLKLKSILSSFERSNF